MISVIPKPEPQDFDARVRKPGVKFLKGNPHPSDKDFKKHNYWSKAAKCLHKAYLGYCAYTTLRLLETGSVDHFLPKTRYPYLAYEWDNYRLARQKINARKGNTEEIVDPFTVQIGWFILDLPSCLIRPGNELKQELRKKINSTINILQLNDDDRLVQERCDFLVNLADGDITMNFLDQRYPFLSTEVKRQGVENRLKVIFARKT